MKDLNLIFEGFITCGILPEPVSYQKKFSIGSCLKIGKDYVRVFNKSVYSPKNSRKIAN